MTEKPLPEPPPDLLQQTAILLSRTRAGDGEAGNDLFRRFQRPLEQFVRARVSHPASADDVVAETQTKAFRAVKSGTGFEYRGVGSFWAFLRQIARNAIVEEARRSGRRPRPARLPDDSACETPDPGSSILTRLIGKEQLETFERALEKETEQHRHAVLLAVELELGYREIAAECGYPSEDAARMSVRRTLDRLAEEVRRSARAE